jgi:hypothetical protein
LHYTGSSNKSVRGLRPLSGNASIAFCSTHISDGRVRILKLFGAAGHRHVSETWPISSVPSTVSGSPTCSVLLVF